jgi:hypothetical protein
MKSRETTILLSFALLACSPARAHAADVFWDGSGDMNWYQPDISSWSGATYNSGDTVNFLGNGPGDINLGTNLTPAAIIVNSAADYRFIGGSISGTTELIKQGNGQLSMNDAGNVHSFTGDVILYGGQIHEVRNGGLGAGSNLIFAGNATFSPDYGGYPTFPHTIIVSNGVTASFSGSTFYFKSYWNGPLTGNGKLQISGGNGTLTQFQNTNNTFTGILQYSGNTGTLSVNSLADSPSSIRLSACRFQLNGGAASSLVFNQRRIELYDNSTSPVYIKNANGSASKTITINTPLHVSGTGNRQQNTYTGGQ